MKFSIVASVILSILTGLTWLMFILFYGLSTSSGDVTIGFGLVLSFLGKLLSGLTIIFGLITMGIAKQSEVDVPKSAIIAVAIASLAFISITVLY